jgi:aromatic-L-amino-acid decarboxylase
MRCLGRSGLQTTIDRAVDLAQELAGWIDADPDFAICAPHPFSTVCFRAHGSDEENARIVEHVNASGEAFISHTRLNDHYVLRVAIGHMRTSRDDVVRAWQAIRAARERG